MARSAALKVREREIDGFEVAEASFSALAAAEGGRNCPDVAA